MLRTVEEDVGLEDQQQNLWDKFVDFVRTEHGFLGVENLLALFDQQLHSVSHDCYRNYCIELGYFGLVAWIGGGISMLRPFFLLSCNLLRSRGWKVWLSQEQISANCSQYSKVSRSKNESLFHFPRIIVTSLTRVFSRYPSPLLSCGFLIHYCL